MKKLTVLSMVTAALLLTACGDSATGAEAKAATETKTEMKCAPGKCGGDKMSAAKDAVANAADKVKVAASEKATEAVASAKEAATSAVDSAKEAATSAVDSAKEAATTAVDSAKEAATSAVDSAKEAATTAVASAKEAAAPAVDAAKLYAKCAACHGADGKTKAMGKSEIIAGQAAADLEKKISEYKAGTRDVAGMGMVMKGQVSSMSDADIKAVASYISGL